MGMKLEIKTTKEDVIDLFGELDKETKEEILNLFTWTEIVEAIIPSGIGRP